MYFSTQPSKSKLLLLSYLWLCRDCNFNNLFSFSAESYPEAVKNLFNSGLQVGRCIHTRSVYVCHFTEISILEPEISELQCNRSKALSYAAQKLGQRTKHPWENVSMRFFFNCGVKQGGKYGGDPNTRMRNTNHRSICRIYLRERQEQIMTI